MTVTISFPTLAFAQLWHVFNMRSHAAGILENDVMRNPFIWGALVLCVGLLLTAVYLPPLAEVLSVVRPTSRGWLLILGISLVPLAAGELYKLVANHAGASR